MTWIRTFSGLPFDPFNPQVENINIEDIAHALSNQCRYSGHTKMFYSVAEHSVRVMRYLQLRDAYPEVQLAGLMHDASEAYLVDMPTPIKNVMPAYQEAEKQVMSAIRLRFNLIDEHHPHIKEADMRALATECRDLMGDPQDWEVLKGLVPWPDVIKPWRSSYAKSAFIAEFYNLKMKI